jgi:hypothetical protein
MLGAKLERGNGDAAEGCKNEAATGSSCSVAAIFLSGPTIDFQAHRGIMDGMESFGRISLSQVCLGPWHLLGFSDLDFNLFSVSE